MSMPAIKHLGVLTTSEHEPTLRAWLEGAAAHGEWRVDEENPDLERILRDFDAQVTEAVVVDDAALPYKDVSQDDLVQYARFRKPEHGRIVFVAEPGRGKDDPFLARLADVGVTRILPTRYYARDPEGAREELLSLIGAGGEGGGPRSLSSYPDEPRRGPFRKRDSPPDVLRTERPPEREEAADGRIDEYSYFAELLGVGGPAAEAPREAGGANEGTDKEESMPSERIEPYSPAGTAPAGGAANGPGPEGRGRPAQEPPERRGARGPIDEATMDALAEAVLQRVLARMDGAQTGEAGPAERRAAPARPSKSTVAVAGVSSGVGTTHLAISCAIHLARRFEGKMVYCLLSDKAEHDLMVSAKSFEKERGWASFAGVRFGHLNGRGWPDDADWAVCDCGILRPGSESRTQAMFNTASRKLVCAGGAPWQAKPAIEIVQATPPADLARWIWCLFGASSDYEGILRSVWRKAVGEGPGMRTFAVPYDTKYLDAGHRFESGYDRLFGGGRGKGQRQEREDG